MSGLQQSNLYFDCIKSKHNINTSYPILTLTKDWMIVWVKDETNLHAKKFQIIYVGNLPSIYLSSTYLSERKRERKTESERKFGRTDGLKDRKAIIQSIKNFLKPWERILSS